MSKTVTESDDAHGPASTAARWERNLRALEHRRGVDPHADSAMGCGKEICVHWNTVEVLIRTQIRRPTDLARLAVELGGQMMGQRFADCRHADRVAQHVFARS